MIYLVIGNILLIIKDFDIIIIYIFLWNICNIFLYNVGWGNFLVKGDNSIVVGIEKIWFIRNLILVYFINGMIEDLVFERYWNDLRGVVV